MIGVRRNHNLGVIVRGVTCGCGDLLRLPPARCGVGTRGTPALWGDPAGGQVTPTASTPSPVYFRCSVSLPELVWGW